MAKILGIAGGTASGKTTLARKLYESTKKVGSVSILKIHTHIKSSNRFIVEFPW